MVKVKSIRGGTALHSKLALVLLVVGALFTMGAKLTMQPIEEFTCVAGRWKGAGQDTVGANTPRSGMSFPVIFVIKADGSFEINTGYWQGTGTMELRDGKIYYTSPVQGTVRVTLYERKGGYVLKGINESDDTTWQVRPARKKRKKK